MTETTGSDLYIFELLAMQENKKLPAIIIKDKQSQIGLIHKIINAKKAENQTVV